MAEAEETKPTITCNGARYEPEGWDGPQPLPSGCGRTIEVNIPEGDPGLTETWDVTTDADGNVIDRHSDVICPFCGTITWVREADLARA